jgi:large subunit ribosomal protein L1
MFRSKKYKANAAKILKITGVDGILSVSDAVNLLVSLEQPNFETTVELHVKLAIDPTKSDQFVRSNVVLPHGTGKKVIVAAFVSPENVQKAIDAGADIAGSEDLVEALKASGKVNFDKAIAEPEMMRKMASIARILGTAGVMPNPKTGTVGEDIAGMIKLIKAGKIDFKNDKTANIHFPVGKINKDFTLEMLIENIEAGISAIDASKPDGVKKKFVATIHITTSMSPSVRVR